MLEQSMVFSRELLKKDKKQRIITVNYFIYYKSRCLSATAFVMLVQK
jgi:hypothetical protein